MRDPDRLQTEARADLCRLLAACYYEPGPELAEEGVFTAMRDAAARIDPALAAGAGRLGAAFAAAEPQALLVDYTRLFLGPIEARAQPYGSVWLPGDPALMRDSTMAVRALYAEGGFDVDEGFRELPDHVAAELEFLYLLLFRECAAVRAADTGASAAVAALRHRFLGLHLGAWAAPFAAAVVAGAETDFYRELGALTGRFVALEAARTTGHAR